MRGTTRAPWFHPSEAGETDILELIAAQTFAVEMRKNRIAAGIDSNAAGKPVKLQKRSGQGAFLFQDRDGPSWRLASGVFRLDLQAVLFGFWKRGKGRNWHRRHPNPRPQFLANGAEAQPRRCCTQSMICRYRSHVPRSRDSDYPHRA